MSEFSWFEGSNRWAACLELTLDVSDNPFVPPSTRWFVVVSEHYPVGELDVYPAKDCGITATFPHQRDNSEGKASLPWRNGKLCLDEDVTVLGRIHAQQQPRSAASRLKWHVLRAIAWVRLTAAGKLVDPSDYFELPDYDQLRKLDDLVVYAEDSLSFSAWKSVHEDAGLAFYVLAKEGPKVMAIQSFSTFGGKPIWRTKWGDRITAAQQFDQTPQFTAWFRLPSVLKLDPWQAPRTWGELFKAIEAQGVSREQLLRRAVRILRHVDRPLRHLLIGFPVPRLASANSEQMYWLALRLDGLAPHDKAAPGFRPTERSRWIRDRAIAMAPHIVLPWAGTENWADKNLVSRGSLPDGANKKSALVIGAGALGSVVAELLVRGGVRSITVVDSERLTAGNLSRHTLTLEEVQQYKASSLALRLRTCSPHVQVTEHSDTLASYLEKSNFKIPADLVVDCTAEDDVLRLMAVHPQCKSICYVSASVGHEAKRLYLFVAHSDAFPYSEFQKAITPWSAKEHEHALQSEYPRDGLGCWHPLFPAAAHDIWQMASIAVRQIGVVADAPPDMPSLLVFERQDDGNVVRQP